MTKSCLIALLGSASLLASGCYCPMLSGRYGELDCYPPCPMPPPTAPAAPETTTATAAPCAAHGCGLFHGLIGGRGFAGLGLAHGENQVPSQQGPDYLSPQPKFHPVPTHPVFEPLLGYPPPQPIDVGGNPLRPSRPKGPGIFGGAVFIPAASRFSAKDAGSLPLPEPTPAPPMPPPDR